MRVTQSMLSNQMTQNLNNNLSRMQDVQQQLATGKKLHRPSDDPVGVSSSLRYRSDIAANEQYQRNMDTAISWLDHSDTVLGQASDVMQRARDLTVQGATGSNSQSSLDSLAAEMDELKEELLEIANSEFNGRYIFNGQRTNQPPYPDEDAYSAETEDPFDTGKISYEVSKGVQIEVNHHAGEVFGSNEAEEGNAFQIMDEVSAALRDGELDTVNEAIGKMDRRTDQVLQAWAEVGAKTNRVDLMENRLKDEDLNLQSSLSDTEDVNMAESITQLMNEENVYRASLSAGARVIQPSLVDFLR